MLKFTGLHCGRCHQVRPLRFTAVLDGVYALGAKAECAVCSYVAFTFVKARDAFCPVCDTLQPLDLVPSSMPGAGFACCGACGQLLGALYEAVPSDGVSVAPS